MPLRLGKDGRIEEIVDGGFGTSFKVKQPLVLGPHGFLPPEAGGEAVVEKFGGVLKKHFETLERLVDAAQSTIKRIENDRDLTPGGRSRKIDSLRTATVVEMGKAVRDLRRQIEREVEAAKKSIPTKIDGLPRPKTPAPEFDPLSTSERSMVNALYGVVHEFKSAQRAAELRAHLRRISSPALRNAAIQAAAEAGDLELLVAVQDSPSALRPALIDDDAWAKATDRYLRTVHASKFEALDNAELALSLFEGNQQLALKALGLKPTTDAATEEPDAA